MFVMYGGEDHGIAPPFFMDFIIGFSCLVYYVLVICVLYHKHKINTIYLFYGFVRVIIKKLPP